MNQKKAVFFSHAARDGQVLGNLKNAFRAKTGGTLDVFLSSDGSSIPFGHNWQKSIEEALKRCELMFVFLSPLSVGSRWIYFESGYAHARGIRVVPVALEGIDLGSEPPPLQLLNGFNLRNHEGLNNILSIANTVFDSSHQLAFQREDYEAILAHTTLGPARALGRYANQVERVKLRLKGTIAQKANEWEESFSNIPGSEDVVDTYEGVVTTLGLRISVFGDTVAFMIDRLAINKVYPLVESLLQSGMPPGASVGVELWMNDGVHSHADELRTSASLIGTEWTLRGRRYERTKPPHRALSVDVRWYDDDYSPDESCFYIDVAAADGIPNLSDLAQTLDFCFEHEILLEKGAR